MGHFGLAEDGVDAAGFVFRNEDFGKVHSPISQTFAGHFVDEQCTRAEGAEG